MIISRHNLQLVWLLLIFWRLVARFMEFKTYVAFVSHCSVSFFTTRQSWWCVAVCCGILFFIFYFFEGSSSSRPPPSPRPLACSLAPNHLKETSLRLLMKDRIIIAAFIIVTIIIIYLVELLPNCQMVVAYLDEIPYRVYKQEGWHDIDESHGFLDRSDVKYSLVVYNN